MKAAWSIWLFKEVSKFAIATMRPFVFVDRSFTCEALRDVGGLDISEDELGPWHGGDKREVLQHFITERKRYLL